MASEASRRERKLRAKRASANDLAKEEAKELLNLKYVYGTSDRATKIMKFGNLLEDCLTFYIHIACDNHIMETSWERTQKEIDYLEEVEQQTKDCYGLKKNSAKRTN